MLTGHFSFFGRFYSSILFLVHRGLPTQKRAFQLSVIFYFLVVSKISLCGQLGQKSAHPKNTIKIGVSATHFVENSSESRNGHFWTKKPKSRNSSYHFFCLFLLLQQQKTQKLAETPIFIVF